MAALCVFLLAACGYDYKDNRIPNYLVIGMAIVGLGYRFWGGGYAGLLAYLGQAAVVTVSLYPFFKIGSLGAGDIKLLGAAAGYLPCGKILAFLFWSLLIAAVFSLIKMWRNHNFRERIGYLSGYLAEIARSGSWRLYLENERDRQSSGIRLSGPVLVSALLYWGGIY